MTLFLVVFASYLSWQASRVFHDYRNTVALRKAQESITNYVWRPMAERPKRVRTQAPEIVLAFLERPKPQQPQPRPEEQPGWRLIAAE